MTNDKSPPGSSLARTRYDHPGHTRPGHIRLMYIIADWTALRQECLSLAMYNQYGYTS